MVGPADIEQATNDAIRVVGRAVGPTEKARAAAGAVPAVDWMVGPANKEQAFADADSEAAVLTDREGASSHWC